MTKRPDARYAGFRYPAEIIATAVWLYFRFPLSLRMVEELLAARGITVSYETVRQWTRSSAATSPTNCADVLPSAATSGTSTRWS